MSTKANYFKIGVFVIAAVVIAVAAVLILGAGAIFEKTIIVETYIDGSVQGLSVGSPLKYRGVQVGKVVEISLVSWVYKTDKNYVLIRAAIPSNHHWFSSEQAAVAQIEKMAPQGLRVRLASQGLTGTAYLETDYLNPKNNPILKIDWEPEYPYLPSAPSIITQLSDSLTRIMTSLEKLDLQKLVANLDETLKTMTETLQHADIKSISDQATALLSEVRETNKHLNDLIAGNKTKQLVADTAKTMAGARQMVEEIKEPLGELLASLKSTSKNINQLAARLDTASASLPDAVAQIHVTLRRLDELLSAPQQDLEETMENLRIFSQDLKRLTQESRRYPSYLLFGEPPLHVRPGEK